MDIRDIKMAFKNADPETKAAVGALLGLGAGGAVGGAIGGWKGAGIGAGTGGVLGASTGLAVPESSPAEKFRYATHKHRNKVYAGVGGLAAVAIGSRTPIVNTLMGAGIRTGARVPVFGKGWSKIWDIASKARIIPYEAPMDLVELAKIEARIREALALHPTI